MKTLIMVIAAVTLLAGCNKDNKKKDYRIEITASNIKAYSYETYENYVKEELSYNQPSFSHSWEGANKNRIHVVGTFDGAGTITVYKEGEVLRTETANQTVNMLLEVEP